MISIGQINEANIAAFDDNLTSDIVNDIKNTLINYNVPRFVAISETVNTQEFTDKIKETITQLRNDQLNVDRVDVDGILVDDILTNDELASLPHHITLVDTIINDIIDILRERGINELVERLQIRDNRFFVEDSIERFLFNIHR